MPSSAPDNPTNSNQKVTNAVVNERYIQLTKTLEALSKEVHEWRKDDELRIREIENWKSQADNEIKTLLVDVVTAQTTADTAIKQSAWWNGVNTFGVIISGALALLGIRIK